MRTAAAAAKSAAGDERRCASPSDAHGPARLAPGRTIGRLQPRPRQRPCFESHRLEGPRGRSPLVGSRGAVFVETRFISRACAGCGWSTLWLKRPTAPTSAAATAAPARPTSDRFAVAVMAWLHDCHQPRVVVAALPRRRRPRRDRRRRRRCTCAAAAPAARCRRRARAWLARPATRHTTHIIEGHRRSSRR